MKLPLRAILSLGLLLSALSVGAESEPETNPESSPVMNQPLQKLAQDFFQWRSIQQPSGGDDIPRVERPNGWLPDWSPRALLRYRAAYRDFLARLDVLDKRDFSSADQLDERLLRAAIERVHWELDVLRAPYRNPLFYIDQTVGSVFELLILSSSMTLERCEEIIGRLNHFPQTLEAAAQNLVEAVRPFAEATIDTGGILPDALAQMEAGLRPVVPADCREDLAAATEIAAGAIRAYARRLESGLDGMDEDFSIGPNAYQWFLAHVALIPHTPQELLAQGRQAWHRAVLFDVLQKNQNRDQAELPLFPSAAHQIEVAFRNEQEIRAFLESNDLMSVPDWLMRYRNRPMPDYLGPLAFMGVNNDLTSETRLDEDAYHYIPQPGPDLPYFYLASARDPRPVIAHEGVPGHYFQMALSWANPDPVRRRYIDSGANEGIGFYVEEMLLQAGLFDYSPRTREIIYSFMRLRALRVEIDIRLATGDFTIEQAGEYLARTVPMDRATAMDEAVFFAFNPGQAISYQVGALQIHKFLADAKLDRAEDFSLRHFHDYLMENGNVPIALLRREYLGRDDDVARLDELSGKTGTRPKLGPPD
jgi:hypothetical protein